jgi:hypothetical protein
MKDTPQQAYVWDMGRICDGKSNTWYMDKVEADGSYTIRGATNSIPSPDLPYFQCMREQFKTHPFLDWAKTRNSEARQLLAAADPATTAAATPPGPVAVPVWRVGDEWQYAYKSPSGSGTYVWAVDRIEPLDGEQHYVVRLGSRERFFRVADLALSLVRDDGVVTLKETPSRLQYDWPLTVGHSWTQSYRDEQPVARRTTDRNSKWTVEAEETVTVGAGTFRALKISLRNNNTSALISETWYAPAAKQWVKLREILTSGTREQELIAYKPK